MMAATVAIALVIAPFVFAAGVKLPTAANKQPATGIAEGAAVRRRTVAIAANGSTRPMWLGADMQETNRHGNIVIRRNTLFSSGALSVFPIAFMPLLDQPNRRELGCHGLCGFRVHTLSIFNGYCCTNCAVYTSRTSLGYKVLGTPLTQHGARCVSRGGPFTNEGNDESDEVQLWDSGDEMAPGDLVGPDLWPDPEVMSEVARHNAATEEMVTTFKRRQRKRKQKIATTEDDWVVLDDPLKQKKVRTTQDDPSSVFAHERRDLPDHDNKDVGGGGGGSGGSGGSDGSMTNVQKQLSHLTLTAAHMYAY